MQLLNSIQGHMTVGALVGVLNLLKWRNADNHNLEVFVYCEDLDEVFSVRTIRSDTFICEEFVDGERFSTLENVVWQQFEDIGDDDHLSLPLRAQLRGGEYRIKHVECLQNTYTCVTNRIGREGANIVFIC